MNQLTQVKDSGGNVIASYTYDDQGRRISMTSGSETSKFHYSGDKVIYTTNASNNIIAEFTYDSYGNPATMTYNNVTYYYHIDGHGNVTAMTDASGNTVAQYTYDAWGKILSQSGSIAAINPFRYAGYRYDEATGLYYLMSRYYDPGVGRFISRDTFHGFDNESQSLNQYAYCYNNPVNYIDPSGHVAWWIAKAAGGITLNVAVWVIERFFIGPKKPWNWKIDGANLSYAIVTGAISGLVGHAFTSQARAVSIGYGIYNNIKNRIVAYTWNGPPKIKQL